MNTAHGTPQVTDEEIIKIFHLVLQVYCSLSLKEYLHNPVMPLLARKKKRRASILCAHGGVCEYMCGGVCKHISMCICVSAIRTVDTNLQVYVHVSVTTQVNAHKHLTITHYFLYMFTAHKLMLQLHTSI